MEIEIKNFGPISYLKFDLSKDLHLLYGRNGTGKSYATYLVYCLLKVLKQEGAKSENHFTSHPRAKLAAKEIEAYLSDIYDVGSADISHILKPCMREILAETVLPSLQNAMLNTFSTFSGLHNQFSQKSFEFTYSFFGGLSVRVYCGGEGNLELDVDFGQSKFEVVRKNSSTKTLHLFLAKAPLGKYTDLQKLVTEIQTEITFSTYFLFTSSSQSRHRIFTEIYYLPASRSGLYQGLSALSPLIAELTQNRHFLQSKKLELPALSEPVADFFVDLSTVDRNNTNAKFEEAIRFLEDRILLGEVDYENQGRRIVFVPKGTNLRLNLSETSSMVAELSPLVVFLKHIVIHKHETINGPKPEGWDVLEAEGRASFELFFIEEPEAHLHPEVQVLLVELFAMLSKQGIKIFMTSHSNYMFNKLNNMLIGGELDENKVEVYHLVSSPEGTVKNPNMHSSSEGIDDENFQETSEKLYLERMALLDAQNDRQN
jgi:hypothetical protein